VDNVLSMMGKNLALAESRVAWMSLDFMVLATDKNLLANTERFYTGKILLFNGLR
jgi:hypothetical protein